MLLKTPKCTSVIRNMWSGSQMQLESDLALTHTKTKRYHFIPKRCTLQQSFWSYRWVFFSPSALFLHVPCCSPDSRHHLSIYLCLSPDRIGVTSGCHAESGCQKDASEGITRERDIFGNCLKKKPEVSLSISNNDNVTSKINCVIVTTYAWKCLKNHKGS